jgi:hypothetical protein
VRTTDLVSILAAEATPTDPHTAGKRFAWALFVGLLGATLLLIAMFGVRSDMPRILMTPTFWLKASFPLAVVAIALFLAGRLARPGASAAIGWLALAIPLLAVWVATGTTIVVLPRSLRLGLVEGNSWLVCTVSIALLSTPALAAVFWAMKGLAPTRLMFAGAGAGLLAGSLAALVYTVYWVEMAAPLWAVWYVTGILVPAAVGGALGPILLRW